MLYQVISATHSVIIHGNIEVTYVPVLLVCYIQRTKQELCCTPGITEQLYWPTDSECCRKFIIMPLFYYTPSLVLELGDTGILAACLLTYLYKAKS